MLIVVGNGNAACLVELLIVSAFHGCCVAARRCDSRVRIIDHFDCEVKRIRKEYKKNPGIFFRGLCFQRSPLIGRLRKVASFAAHAYALSSKISNSTSVRPIGV